MPEPMPYYPSGAMPPVPYNSLSHSLHTSSSSVAPSLSHRTTAASSITNDNSSRPLPQYSNGSRSTSHSENTLISSSNGYLPHASSASYLDGTSSGIYLPNINETGDDDDVYRPSGALPNAPSYSSQSPLFDSYPNEKLDANGYRHQESLHNQPHHVTSYGSQPLKPSPIASQHSASSSEHHFDFSPKYAEADRQVPSGEPQYEYPEAGPSNIGIAAQEDEEIDWDPNSYVYGYDGPGGLAPGDDVHRATEMLRSMADYSPRGRLELHDEPQDEFWEDEEEEDESRFVNFSLLSHIAVQLRDKVPRGTHVKGSIPYPRAFTGKDIVVCTFQIFSFFVVIHSYFPSSQPYNYKSSVNLQSTMECRRATDGQPYK
jgi:RHO1 GDP-GTP exchange protein 1/2